MPEAGKIDKNRLTDQNAGDAQELTTERRPPMEWFFGMGYKKVGIMQLRFNNPLTDMDNGKVGREMGEWSHFTGNAMIKDASLIAEPGLRERLLEVEKYILIQTGFTPRQLKDFEHELSEMYDGKFEAPFPIEILDEEELHKMEEMEKEEKRKAKLVEQFSQPGTPPLYWFMVKLEFVPQVEAEVGRDVAYTEALMDIGGGEAGRVLEQIEKLYFNQPPSGPEHKEARKQHQLLIDEKDKRLEELIGFSFSDVLNKGNAISKAVFMNKPSEIPAAIRIKDADRKN